MSHSTQQLNPLTFPLAGSALIEASAGTGKTYTLALLYLRLVLKHGGENSFTDYLLPPNILVVTFTKAATRELRDRIRARLVETAAYFRADEEASTDMHLRALRKEVEAETSLYAAARRLDIAAEWMDEAAVSTIHSWCSRVLSEHAFYSGLNFQQTLLENEKPLVIQACEDYWREKIFTLEEPELRQVLAVYSAPMALHRSIGNLIYKVHGIAPVGADISAELQAITTQRATVIDSLKAQVSGVLPTLIEDFEAAAKGKLFKAASLNKNHRASVFDGLAQWCASEGENLALVNKLFQGKSFAKIALLDTGFWLDEGTIPVDRGAAAVLAKLPEVLDQLPTPNEFLIAHSTHWVAARVEDEKAQRGVLSQNDLLDKLDKALQDEGGAQLAEVIRKQFPVALVDEFQDTDPVQYRIFNAIYRVAEPHPDTGFFMIGDPKQAIYRFRGADIFTYLSAKRDTGNRQYTLTHNFRSSPRLVNAVNGFFERAEQAHPNGAFLFRQGQEDPIPFLPVQAGKKDEIALLVEGEPQAPQNLWDLTPENGEASDDPIDRAVATASQIAHLLNLSNEDSAAIDLGDGPRPLQPKDFAVLVNSGVEARKIRRALFDVNLSSVYLSDANDVFDTEDADDILHVLKAMAEPFNSFNLRVALGTRLMGMSLAELDALNHDEIYWEGFIEQFRRYHHHWFEFGIMATLHRFFTEQKVPERYLNQPNGERSITDLFHISELLQQASETIQGQQALIHHLEQCITAEKSGQESTQQRLESDADLVQVVTVHKSKGLQYPLVMLPYLDAARTVKSSDLPIEYHDDQENLVLSFSPSNEQVARADSERLAEDVRKIYVAMTRAICAQWLAIGDAAGSELGDFTSAAHALLGASANHVVAAHQEDSEVFSVVQAMSSVAPYVGLTVPEFCPARQVNALSISPWWIASYSSLSFGGKEGGGEIEAGSPEQAIDEQMLDDDQGEPVTEVVQSHKLMHKLPRGSHMGTFLHGIIEWAAEQRTEINGEKRKGFAAVQGDADLRLNMLESRCRKRNLSEYAEPLSDWLGDFLGKTWRLDRIPEQAPVTFRLMDVPPEDMAVELEFMFSASKVQAQHLDSLVRQQTWGGQERPAAQYQMLEGMFKGFIDLVAKVDGKYYVIDWKSNGLGADDAAYDEASLRDALLKKRYDLQYVLYLVALHRHLKERIPGYRYEEHIGGAVYYFIRGYENETTQGLIMDKPPKALIEALDKMFAGETVVLQQELSYV